MRDRERGDEGISVETDSLEDVLDVFEDVRGPVITSSDVADQFDCSTDIARQKLQQLCDRGEVDKRKTGGVVVWWFTGDPSLAASESGEVQGDIETSLDENLPGEHIGEDS